MPRRKRIYAAWFVLHFLVIILISGRDTLWLIAQRLTILPSAFVGIAGKVEPLAAATVGRGLESSNPLRRGLFTYFDLAGIDRGYGYFAPNIPGSYKLVFELHYPDGRVEYALPSVNSKAAGLRVASLLDEIGRADFDALREYLIKGITRSIWREHPEATAIRAIFGISVLPTIAEFEKGKRESYKFLYAYDLSLEENPATSKTP